MTFVKAHLEIKNTFISECDFTSQIPSQAISAHLVEEHAHTAPIQCFKQLPTKTQNPRKNPILSKHEGTDFTQQTFL